MVVANNPIFESQQLSVYGKFFCHYLLVLFGRIYHIIIDNPHEGDDFLLGIVEEFFFLQVAGLHTIFPIVENIEQLYGISMGYICYRRDKICLIQGKVNPLTDFFLYIGREGIHVVVKRIGFSSCCNSRKP